VAREEIVKMVVPSAGDPRVGPQDCEPGAGMDGPNSGQSSIACADIVTEGGPLGGSEAGRNWEGSVLPKEIGADCTAHGSNRDYRLNPTRPTSTE
jgi:hypothetical protein